MRLSDRYYGAVVALIVLAVLASHIHVGLRRVRHRVVRAPITAIDGQLTIPLPDLTDLSGQPAAIIARMRAPQDAVPVEIRLDDEVLGYATASHEREARVDFATDVMSGPGHTISFLGQRSWTLTYLEVANVHGHTTGRFGFVVVPRTRPSTGALPWWLIAAAGFGLLLLRPRLDWSRFPRQAVSALSLLVAGFFALVLAADLLTRFKILLSIELVGLAVALIYWAQVRQASVFAWEQLWRASLFTWDQLRRAARFAWRNRRFAPHALTLIAFLAGVSRFYSPATGFSSLIAFGSQFEARLVPSLKAVPHHVDPNSGYDGQFYAQLALDPLLRDPATPAAMDDSAYRARRILVPALAYVAGFGRAEWIIQAYALINVATWLILAGLMLRWLPPGSVRPTVAWVACMMSDGLLASVRRSLLDGPSVLFLVLGLIALERNRHLLSAFICGASGLARETNLLGSAMLLSPRLPSRRHVRTLILGAALVILPLAGWLMYLDAIGLDSSPGGRNLTAPLSAYFQKWSVTLAELRSRGLSTYAPLSALTLIALTTQSLTMIAWRRRDNAWWRMGVPYAVLMFVLGGAVWEGHPGAAARVLTPLTFAFHVLLPRSRWFWPLLVLANANLLHGLREVRIPGLDE